MLCATLVKTDPCLAPVLFCVLMCFYSRLMLRLTRVKTDPCLVAALSCVLLHSSGWPCPGYVLRSCPFQPRALSHSCLHLCHVPAMSCVLHFKQARSCAVTFPVQPRALSHSCLQLCHVPVVSCVLLYSKQARSCAVTCLLQPRALSHSCLHLCHDPAMPRVLSTPAVGLVHPDCLVHLSTPSSSHAVSDSSLPSTALPCLSHATCSFHSSCWPSSARLSCALVHSILVTCRV